MANATKSWLRSRGPWQILGALFVGAIVGLVSTKIVQARAIRPDYYLSIATTVPIVVLALVVRLGSWGEEALADEYENLKLAHDNVALARSAAASGDIEFASKVESSRQRLMTMEDRSVIKLGTSLLATFLFTVLSESAALSVLASGRSTVLSFMLASWTAFGLLALLFWVEGLRLIGQKDVRQRRIEVLSEPVALSPTTDGESA